MTTVLLVEDNEMNRDMLMRRLQRKGFNVLIALDGDEAIRMTREHQPEIVLMDMSLPVIDGWEATRRLKADPATKDIPVIALTAHALPAERDKALEAGCAAFETKPIDFPKLLAVMEREKK
ncbi:MAG: response regulator [Acidobacteria bacterium]|nr:response regulator [Acidobacteriota bacterium]